MSDDRISRLSQRFHTHAVGRRPTSEKSRERTSLYIDMDLVSRLDQAYRALNHDLYPDTVNKSAFLESVMEYGLAHLDEFKDKIPANPAKGEASGTS